MKTNSHRLFSVLTLSALATLNTPLSTVSAQGTAFTYQGRLNDGGSRANGIYDLQFTLFDAATGGNQVGATVTNLAVGVTNGLFLSTIDFGPVFDGTALWLQIGVETNGAGGNFTPLSALQPLTPAPYAVFAAGAGTAATATTANSVAPGSVTAAGVASGQVVKSLNGLADAVTLAAGANINLTPNGNTLTIASTGGGGGGGEIDASQVVSGTLADARLAADVALTDATQTFTGTNTFATGLGQGRLTVTGFGGIDTSLFTGLGFQYNASSGEGAIMSSYTGGFGSLTFYTTPGQGYPPAKQMMLDRYGGLAIDQQNANSGVIDNGTTNGVGLTFGINSGEGIASQRTGSGNLYGLDFYTEFTPRLSIAQNGFVGIGTTAPGSPLEVNGDIRIDGNRLLLPSVMGNANDFDNGLAYYTSGLPFVINGQGPLLFGFNGGALGTLGPLGVSLSWDYTGDVWISNNLATASLTIRGASASPSLTVSGNSLNVNSEFLVVDGLSPVDAYLGDDGSGNDVQVGSQVSGVTALSCFNTADNAYMNLFCNSVNANGSLTAGGSINCNNGTLSFGATTRQMLNLYSNSVTDYAIGVQNQDLYFRCGADVSGTGFAWFRGGLPNSNPFNNGGGSTLMTLTTAGLTVNGTLVSSSDRNLKQSFAPVDCQSVLAKVAQLPVQTWAYKQDPGTKHLGPMAQDFYAAFGTGADDKHIAVVDEGGVALAAIQGLNQKLEETQRAVYAKDGEIQTLRQQNDSLAQRLEQLEAMVKQLAASK